MVCHLLYLTWRSLTPHIISFSGPKHPGRVPGSAGGPGPRMCIEIDSMTVHFRDSQWFLYWGMEENGFSFRVDGAPLKGTMTRTLAMKPPSTGWQPPKKPQVGNKIDTDHVPAIPTLAFRNEKPSGWRGFKRVWVRPNPQLLLLPGIFPPKAPCDLWFDAGKAHCN